MFTGIVYRQNYEEWRNGYQESSSESRMEIVYNVDLEVFVERLQDVLKSFTRDVVTDDAWSPDVDLLYNGAPFLDLEANCPEEICSLLLNLTGNIDEIMSDYQTELRHDIAVAANEARLERERKQRELLEESEREQLARLQAKYQ